MENLFLDAHPPKYRQEGNESPEKNAGKTGTILSEDYAEIVDEEGDYSTPASMFYFFILLKFFLVIISILAQFKLVNFIKSYFQLTI